VTAEKTRVVNGVVYVAVEGFDLDDGDSAIPFLAEEDLPPVPAQRRRRTSAGF